MAICTIEKANVAINRLVQEDRLGMPTPCALSRLHTKFLPHRCAGNAFAQTIHTLTCTSLSRGC